MDKKEFAQRVYLGINQKKQDTDLYKNENRFLRSGLIYNIIRSLSNLINYFDLQNEIIFEDKTAFIKVSGLKLMICTPYYLKHVGTKITSTFIQSEEFLSNLNIKPKNIIDIGACWGECSMYLASKFQEAKIFSVEGSPKNYNILKKNLSHNPQLNSLIKPFNIIMSGKDGFDEISNTISTMNVVKKIKIQNLKFENYETIKTLTLKTFLKENNVCEVDFLKIDIEGSEQDLIEDLLTIKIKSMQIELINYNSLDTNLSFIKRLFTKFNIHNPENWNYEDLEMLNKRVTNHFKKYSHIDLFLSFKEEKI